MTTTSIAPPRSAAALFATDDVRVEGREKVSGAMQYTADIGRPDALWAAYAVSPFAHARVLSVDVTKARALPGVKAILTAAEIGPRRFGRNIADWPVLAYERVRLIGDRVAAVAAETREIAEEAASLIEVEYEELTPILDPFEALAPDAPVLHPDRASYYWKAYDKKTPPVPPHPNVQGTNRFHKGAEDLTPFFAPPYRVFEHTFTTPRLSSGYIEPRATMVWIDPDGIVHVQSPNKSPYNLREQLAQCAGIPKERIVVEPSAIGGDFGGKGMTIDEFPCYFLAAATGRPVRHVATYAEELGIAATRHRAYVTLTTAVDADGNFVAHRSDVVYDGGAYAGAKPGGQLLAGTGYATVPYRIPNVDVRVKSVYTTTVPGAHVRAPIDVQIFFAWEQHVDMIARELGTDPLALRKRNVVREGDTPLTDEAMHHPMGLDVLARLERESGHGKALPRDCGRGYAFGCRHTGGGKTSLKMRATAGGAIEVLTGVPDQGAGAFTVVRRVAAATLDVKPERIAVRRGNTLEANQDPGAGGSRVTHVVGGAAQDAAEKLRALLEERSGMQLAGDGFVDPANGRTVPFEEVAARVCADGPLEVVGAFDGSHDDPSHPADFTFSGYAVDVKVDRETGTVEVLDALLVTDVGRVINPVAHRGQINGGFVFGIGSALLEEIRLDESGKVMTLSLGEYKLPTTMDVPPFRSVLVEAPPGAGPYGAKMAGELSNSGVAPAIANAIYDAVGVRLSEFPFKAERVYALLHENAAPA